MIHLIYGKKGSGKSKRLLNLANADMETNHGNIVYIDDNNRCMYDLRHQIRFINTSEYSITNTDQFYGFICGILSRDFDISSIYIDGLKHLASYDSDEFKVLIERLDGVFKNINAYIVVSGSDDVPEHLAKFIMK